MVLGVLKACTFGVCGPVILKMWYKILDAFIRSVRAWTPCIDTLYMR